MWALGEGDGAKCLTTFCESHSYLFPIHHINTAERFALGTHSHFYILIPSAATIIGFWPGGPIITFCN